MIAPDTRMYTPIPSLPPVPVLTTARLTLRGHTQADFDESAAMWADPDVTRYIGGRPFTREEAWARLLRYLGHWALLGFGYWVVRETATNRFVGEVGFVDYQREIEPSLEHAPEIGWVLSPAVHGQGFATEAVSAIIAWGESRFPGARTVCLIDPGNTPSLRVAEKCGYRELARASYRGEPSIILERPGNPEKAAVRESPAR
jgi:RimJ/RimL family protein N-acetyltransferase